MEILSDPTPDMLAMPRFDDGAIDMQELLRRLAEQVVNAVMDAEADPALRLPASQASSAWASMISLTSDSAIALMSSDMLTMPSSNLGMRAPSPAISCILSICGYRLSVNLNLSNSNSRR